MSKYKLPILLDDNKLTQNHTPLCDFGKQTSVRQWTDRWEVNISVSVVWCFTFTTCRTWCDGTACSDWLCAIVLFKWSTTLYVDRVTHWNKCAVTSACCDRSNWSFFTIGLLEKMWVRLSSLRKRGHQKPLLICQAIFISFANCSAVLHSMSFIIQRLKIIKKWIITTKWKEWDKSRVDSVYVWWDVNRKDVFFKKKQKKKGLTVFLK